LNDTIYKKRELDTVNRTYPIRSCRI